MVCFMTLSWQMVGAESSRTWGTKRENIVGPRTGNPEANKWPSPQAPPPAGHTTHFAQQWGPQPTFWVSAHCGLTFQEFPKSTGSSSTWRLLLVRSLFWTPSKFPHRPHTRSWGTSRGSVNFANLGANWLSQEEESSGQHGRQTRLRKSRREGDGRAAQRQTRVVSKAPTLPRPFPCFCTDPHAVIVQSLSCVRLSDPMDWPPCPSPSP